MFTIKIVFNKNIDENGILQIPFDVNVINLLMKIAGLEEKWQIFSMQNSYCGTGGSTYTWIEYRERNPCLMRL